MPTVRFVLDGLPVSVDVAPDTPLLYVLRDGLGLSNPHFGCGLAQCGACTVHLDGEPLRACIAPVEQRGGPHDHDAAGPGHPGASPSAAAGLLEEQVPQCGYCVNGWIMTAAAMLKKTAGDGCRAAPGACGPQMPLWHAPVDPAGDQAGADQDQRGDFRMSHASRREFLLAAGALLVMAAPSAHSCTACRRQRRRHGRPAPTRGAGLLACDPARRQRSGLLRQDGHGPCLEVAIAQIVAEELDVAVGQRRHRHGRYGADLQSGRRLRQHRVSQGAKPLRNAAAEARRILLEAAAARLGAAVADLESIRTAWSVRARHPGGREAMPDSWAAGSSRRRWNGTRRPATAWTSRSARRPKPPATYRVVGTSVPRRDLAGKVFGTRDFVTDMRMPGMLHARMIRPPRAGQRIAQVDERSHRRNTRRTGGARAGTPGRRAPKEWTAIQAAASLRVSWSRAKAPTRWPGHDGLHARIRAAPVLKREEHAQAG